MASSAAFSAGKALAAALSLSSISVKAMAVLAGTIGSGALPLRGAMIKQRTLLKICCLFRLKQAVLGSLRPYVGTSGWESGHHSPVSVCRGAAGLLVAVALPPHRAS